LSNKPCHANNLERSFTNLYFRLHRGPQKSKFHPPQVPIDLWVFVLLLPKISINGKALVKQLASDIFFRSVYFVQKQGVVFLF